MKILILASGTYPVPMPEALRTALAAEVEQHMKGYGIIGPRVWVTYADAKPKKE